MAEQTKAVEFTASSGAKIVINEAGWPEAKRLKMAIQNELANAGVRLTLESDIAQLAGTFLKVDGSKSVDDALWPCLARCTWNGLQIKESLFDEEKSARRDYYDIVLACGEANLRPLCESLYLRLQNLLKAKKKDAEKSPT